LIVLRDGRGARCEARLIGPLGVVRAGARVRGVWERSVPLARDPGP
jgi:hypothetical protein